MKTVSLSHTTYSPGAQETTDGLRRVALLASGIAAMIAAATAAVGLRFALFGIGHESMPAVARLRDLIGL